MDKANKELAIAGPNVRMIEVIICARPFVAPKEARFGEDAAMKMKTQPKVRVKFRMQRQRIMK